MEFSSSNDPIANRVTKDQTQTDLPRDAKRRRVAELIGGLLADEWLRRARSTPMGDGPSSPPREEASRS